MGLISSGGGGWGTGARSGGAFAHQGSSSNPGQGLPFAGIPEAVSYTHLTLPTNREV